MNGLAREPAVLEPLAAAAQDVGALALANQLLEMRQWMADDLAELEAQLNSLDGLNREPEQAKKAAAYLLASGGKRVRPMIVMLSARLGQGAPAETVRDLAVTCELIHAATLLHDDVIDEGAERRGAPSARIVYSNSASILGGDHLLIEALRLVQKHGDGVLLSTLLDTISDIITAEALQLQLRGRFQPDRDLYLRVIRGKTAVLFRWGFAAGARAAGLSPTHVETLKSAGMALGEAFQLVDDVLDLAGDPNQTGKALFTDLREGKLTWPLILASEQVEGFDAHVQRCMDEPDGLDSQGVVVQTLQRCGALEATRHLAEQRVDEARQLIATLPQSRARAALDVLARAVVERKG